MVRLLQSTVQGLGLGTVYVLLGLGFVIIFKSMGVISFAQPGMMVLGAWWVIYFGRILGLGFPLAVLIAVLLTALIGMALERAAIRPMIGEPVFAIAILTIGLDIVLRVIVNDLLGPQGRSMGDRWEQCLHCLGRSQEGSPLSPARSSDSDPASISNPPSLLLKRCQQSSSEGSTPFT